MEEWRGVSGFPDYEVSSLGRVRRITVDRKGHRPRILKLWPNNKGYRIADLTSGGVRRHRSVHILVCEAFNGQQPSPAHEVAHGDGTPDNNVPSNLRWATRAENMQDALRHGTFVTGDRHWSRAQPEMTSKGEAHGSARLTEAEVLAIRDQPASKGVDLATQFNVSPATICMIRSRKIWRHL